MRGARRLTEREAIAVGLLTDAVIYRGRETIQQRIGNPPTLRIYNIGQDAFCCFPRPGTVQLATALPLLGPQYDSGMFIVGEVVIQ